MDCQGPVLDRGTHPASGTWCYRAFGLAISSEIALPQLPSTGPAAADLSIVVGVVEPSFRSRPGYRRGRIFDQFLYEARQGRRIVIEPLPGASPANISDGLMSRVLTIALYQRGLLPIHASAVSFGGATIAVCGASGAGKSTLAAMLAGLGAVVVADDMLVLAATGDPRAASTGAKGLKLSVGSLDAIGMTRDGLAPANTEEGKYFLPLPPADPALPARIVSLVCLRHGPPRIERLEGARALAEWKNCVKMPELIEVAPDRNGLWRRWLALVNAAETLLVSHGQDIETARSLAERLAAEADGFGDMSKQGRGYERVFQPHAGPAQA